MQKEKIPHLLNIFLSLERKNWLRQQINHGDLPISIITQRLGTKPINVYLIP